MDFQNNSTSASTTTVTTEATSTWPGVVDTTPAHSSTQANDPGFADFSDISKFEM